LEKIQQTGCAEAIRKVVENGKIYIGSSAGSVIAGPDIYPVLKFDSVEKAPNLKGYEGLGLVNFILLPHWGSEDFRNLYLSQGLDLAYDSKNKFILLRDGQYVQVEDDKYKIVDVVR
jgi:dipeptidase E